MIVALLAASLAISTQGGQGLKPAGSGPVAKSVKAAAKTPAAPLSDNTLCTINVLNEDPIRVLQTLGTQASQNILLLDPPAIKITTNLKNVRFIDILRHLCAVMGVRHLKVGNTYVLATAEKLSVAYPKEWAEASGPKVEPPTPPEIVSQIYECNFVSAAQIAQALTQLFGEGKLSVVSGPVQSNPSVGSQSVDDATGQKTSMLQKDGDQVAALAGKTLILRGERPLVEEALALAKRMDSMRPQVAIEVRVHDILDSAVREAGISWNFGGFNITERSDDGVGLRSFDRSSLNFNGLIKALETQDKARLLASPNISVLDGERAFVLVGDRIAFPVLVGFGQGNVPIFSKEEVRVGVYLQVAANVSSDGQITLSLYPQVSNIVRFEQINGASYPQVSTREAQSTLRLRSGDTIVMGGLMRTDEISTLEKVPILGDLPFLGELFRRRRTTKSASQVVISITPRLITTDESR